MQVPEMPQEFRRAVARKDWETAALYAIVAAAELIERIGPEAAQALIDELEADLGPPHRGSRARR